MRGFFLLVLFVIFIHSGEAFQHSSSLLSFNNRNVKCGAHQMTSSDIHSTVVDPPSVQFSRRSMFQKVTFKSASVFGAMAIFPTPAVAKKEAPSPEVMKSIFTAIRLELEGQQYTVLGEGGGMFYLGKQLDDGNWTEIKEFTKFYDLEFRKAKMARVRKMMTDKEIKGVALQFSNNVTFDLIGINRAARTEDTAEARKYFDELKIDIKAFLDLESKVVLE